MQKIFAIYEDKDNDCHGLQEYLTYQEAEEAITVLLAQGATVEVIEGQRLTVVPVEVVKKVSLQMSK